MVGFAAPACLLTPAQAVVPFVRGDFNADGQFDLSDGVAVLFYLFHGQGSPACLDAGDSNDDDMLDVADAVRAFDALFLGGPPPSAPFPECGLDLVGGGPGCDAFPPCPDVRSEIVALRRIDGEIEIELFSTAPFPVRALYPALCIGNDSFERSRSPLDGNLSVLIFSLTEAEFEGLEDGGPVSIRYGGCQREIAELRPYWDLWLFPPFDRGLLAE